MDQTTLDFNPTDPNKEQLVLAQYAQRAYLDYAISVVKGRALPEVADGQKPVQRRILYAMQRMGLGHSGTGASGAPRPVKSARVVGDVLGKYHPHGDTSTYDAMVRMAQGFSQRYPLVDGQGNYGSRDGDNAAAYRYTEARLTPIARLLLDELDDGTVEFGPNYDGSQEEPKLLPARLPFVLLNGASGIAVGMATEVPSHNLREVAAAAVALIRNPQASLDDVMAHIAGPDFANGGHIISSAADIREAYASGRGSVKVRARWVFEEMARGQWQLVVTELPPGATVARVMEEIEELSNPKVKAGKKPLTPDQQQNKALLLGVLDTVRDESSKDAAVRIVCEPKTSRTQRDELVNVLLTHTSMECNASINLTMIGIDGKPRPKGLLDILREWLEFRFATVRRRTEHRLAQVDARIHILDGRKLILLNIDEVIRIIRQADDPKTALIARFSLSELQADDILDLRLRQLARLEAIKIEEELKKLGLERAELQALLADDKVLRRLVIKEIEADAKLYGDARRTLIQQEQKASVDVKLMDEPVTVVVSQKGWVRARGGHGHDASGFAFKAGDSMHSAWECRTVDTLLVFSSAGRVHSVPVAALPNARGDGAPITTLIELASGTQPLHYFAGSLEQSLLLATSDGMGFIAKVGDMASRMKAGKAFINVEAGVLPLVPFAISSSATQIAALASNGKLLVFGLDEMKTLANGGKGVIVMDLAAKETLIAAITIGASGLTVSGTGRGGATRLEPLGNRALAPYVSKRARKGRELDVTFKALNIAPQAGSQSAG